MAKLLALARRAHIAVWARRARTRMRWVGIRAEIELGEGVVFVRPPYVLAGINAPDGVEGNLRVRVGNRVRFGPGVIIEAEPGVESTLEIGDGTRIGANVHIHLRGGTVRIGPHCEIRDGVVFKTTGGDIELGHKVYLSYEVIVHATELVALGDLVGVSERSTIVDSSHDLDGSDVDWRAQTVPVAAVRIGSNTLLMANVMALMGTTVGPNSRVAAGSVLQGDYPAGASIAGVPARVVRMLGERE